MQAGAATIAEASRFLIREAIITTSPMLVSLAKLIRDYESGREEMAEYVANDDPVAQEKIIDKQFKEVCFICEKVLSPFEGERNLTTAMHMLEEHRRKMGETYQHYVDMDAVSMVITRYKNGRVSKEPEYPNGELYFDHCVYGFLLDLMHAARHIRFKHTPPQDVAVFSIYNDYLNDAIELQYSNPNPQIMFSNWSRIKTKQNDQYISAAQMQPDALSEDDEVSSGEEMSDDEESTDADDCNTSGVLHSDPNSENPFVLLSDIPSRQVLRNNVIIPASSHVDPAVSKAPYAPQIGDMFGLWFPSSQAYCGATKLDNDGTLPSSSDQVVKISQQQSASAAADFIFSAQSVMEESVSLGTLTPSTLSPILRCDSPCELPSLQELQPAEETVYPLSQGSMFEACPRKVVSAIIPDYLTSAP